MWNTSERKGNAMTLRERKFETLKARRTALSLAYTDALQCRVVNRRDLATLRVQFDAVSYMMGEL